MTLHPGRLLSSPKGRGANLIQNGTFEHWTDGNPDNWVVATESSPDYEIKENIGGCQLVTAWQFMSIGQDVGMISGNKYRLSIDVSALTGLGIELYQISSASGGTLEVIGQITTLGKHSFEFTASKPAIRVARIAGGATDCTFDNIVLRKI